MPGISGFALYLPPHRVQLADWCEWRDQPWEKVRNVVGESFRVCGPEQDVYTLAATAVLRLIDAYGVDPASVGQLALGTESASDNSAGAVIVRGMVDAALVGRGDPPLARDCEVPEIKHACLGGIYALKQSLRYLATDGAQRTAIVVSADIAEYAPGSSGEPTQGAGAIAMLLEPRARLLEVNVAAAASASNYRSLDFRKPFLRFSGQAISGARPHDYPVFNGRFSTACYFDSVRDVVGGLRARNGGSWQQTLADWDAIFMHRPYARMPETAWGMLWLHALAADGDPAFDALCADAGLEAPGVAAELAAAPDLASLTAQGRLDTEVYPQAQLLLRNCRRSPDYATHVTGVMGPGEPAMRALGNLYTAALPAWLAAGLVAALEQEPDCVGHHWLAVGYGSGDAAEALPLTVMPDWQAAAQKIDLATALAGAVDLTADDYAALHGGGQAPPDDPPVRDAFVITAVGQRDESSWADLGIASYRYRDGGS